MGLAALVPASPSQRGGETSSPHPALLPSIGEGTAVNVKSIRGRDGEVTIPAIGASVGDFREWHLARREDPRSGKPGVLTLRAVFRYVNPALFNEPSLRKQFIVQLDRKRKFRVDQDPAKKPVLEGLTLTMEGVTLCPLPK